MKGASKVIMGATLAMVVSLAIVLGLILVLLAELYCSLLLRRRQLRLAASTTTAAAPAAAATIPTVATANATASPPSRQHSTSASPPPLATYYSQGVIQAPRSLLFPLASGNANSVEEAAAASNQLKIKKLHHVLDIHAQELGLTGTSPSCLSIANSSPVQVREIPAQVSPDNACQEDGKSCAGAKEHFVYISNPIYDNDACRAGRVDTPFETPDSSPSRLEMGYSSSNSSSSGDEEEVAKLGASTSCQGSLPGSDTPPLTPMKKLPAEACSVSLRDARSLGTSGSDSVSNNGLSSSSSGSPCTSPSW